MLSAKANSVSLKPAPAVAVWHLLHRLLHNLIRRSMSSTTGNPQPFPDELRADIGLGEAPPTSRAESFWEGRRGSTGRDLPL